MMYIDDYKLLRSKINYEDDHIPIDDRIEVNNFSFVSKNFGILPGEDSYLCKMHDYASNEYYNFDNKTGVINEVLDIHDSKIEDNARFRYHVFSPRGTKKAKEIVLLLHGFNEKDWYKYLPWAKRIAESTQKTVALFPIAFHMNRAPSAWTNARLMYDASLQRKQLFPNIISSSLSNVAISTRIHAKPERFVWSGLQTYYDVIDFIASYKAGEHPLIAADASIDLFAYSIGAFLSQILMMSNHNNYFAQSKLCIFCGGAVFNRFSPVSKFILDSEANVNLYSFIIEHLESHLKNDKRLNHYLNGDHSEGLNFRMMLNYKINSTMREEIFRKLSHRIMSLCLLQDSVIPPYEVVNSLQGKYRDIPIKVHEMDFPYPYKHEDPFPALEKYRNETDAAFNKVFGVLCDFLK